MVYILKGIFGKCPKITIVRNAFLIILLFTPFIFSLSFLALNHQIPTSCAPFAPLGALRPATLPGSSDPTQDEWSMFRGQLNHTGEAHTTPTSSANSFWTFTTSGDIFSSPAVTDGRMYVGSYDKKVYCLNATTGGFLWSYLTEGSVGYSSPAVAGGRLYIGSFDKKVYCLNAITGGLLWTYTTGDGVDSSPAVAAGRVYVGSYDRKLYCLNATTGKQLWNKQLWNYSMGRGFSSPAVAGERVYVGSGAGIYCLNATTGKQLWNSPIGYYVLSSPALAGGCVYIGIIDPYVYCLNATTGKQLWNYPMGRVSSSPAVAGGRIYVGDNYSIRCLNAATGGLLWTYFMPGDHSSPAVTDGRVYVGSTNSKVYCLNAITGKQFWNYTTGGAVQSSPAIAGGRVYVGSCDGKVYCLPCIFGNQTVPTAPQNLQAIAGNGQITLTWQAPASNGGSMITNYKIYRGTVSGGETYYTTLGNVLTYTNTGLTNGQIYYYKVSAVNGVGEGSRSTEVSATPAMVPPLITTVLSLDFNPVILSNETNFIQVKLLDNSIKKLCIHYSFDNCTTWQKSPFQYFSDEFKNQGLGQQLGVTAIGDSDNDGRNELVVVYGYLFGSGSKHLSIYKWNETNYSYKENFQIELPVNPHSIVIEDADNDGSNEIIIGMWNGDNHLDQFDWNGNTYIRTSIINSDDPYPLYRITGLAIGDLDEDTLNELLVCDCQSNVYIFKYEAGTYNSIYYSLFNILGTPGACIGDFSNDGLNDFIVGGEVFIRTGNTFIPIQNLSYCMGGVKIGNIDRDKENEVIRQNNIYQYNAITGLLEPEYSLSQKDTWDCSWTLHLGNFDRDEEFEIVNGRSIDDFNPNGYFEKKWEQNNFGNTWGTIVACGDADNDGFTEFFIGGECLDFQHINNSWALYDLPIWNSFSNGFFIPATEMETTVKFYFEIFNSSGVFSSNIYSYDSKFGGISGNQTVPTAPQNLQAAAGNKQVVLTWQAPSSNGGSLITNYKIYRGTSSGNETYFTAVGNILNYTNTGLSNGQIYYYKVSAVNGVGEGALSNEANTTPATVPNAPQNLQAIAENWVLGGRTIILIIRLSWQAPVSNGGSSITNYKIYRGIAPEEQFLLTTIGNNLIYIDMFVVKNRTYYYKVSAINSIGEGPTSNEASATPQLNFTYPSAPENLQCSPRNGQIILNWQLPISDGGLSIINYKIYRGTSYGGEMYLTTVGNVLIYTDTDLTNGQTYYYKVSAVNGVGEGPLSNEVNATPATVPMAPQNLQAIAGNGQITLTWQAPSSNGGSSITNYRIYRSNSPGNESLLTTIGTVLTYTDINLTNGHRYYYRISAINGMGEGDLSIEVYAKPATVPDAPHHLLILVNKGKIVLTWQTPADNGGDAIISYKIYRGTSSNNETYLITIGNSSSFTDTNFVNGQTYYYRITAVNALGESPWSAEVVVVVSISENNDQTFNVIIILLCGTVLMGISGALIHFRRRLKSLEGKIAGMSIAPLGQKAAKPWKKLARDSFAVEDQINQLPMPVEERKMLLTELQGIENDERLEVFNNISGHFSESEAELLWNSLHLRFNRLYKVRKWNQALILLEQLADIAEFLGDSKKMNDLALKYEEIQEKL